MGRYSAIILEHKTQEMFNRVVYPYFSLAPEKKTHLSVCFNVFNLQL